MNEYFLREMVLKYAQHRLQCQYYKTKEQQMQEADPLNNEGIAILAEVSKSHLCMAEELLNLICSYATEHSK